MSESRSDASVLPMQPKQFGLVKARNYDDPIDHPVEMGTSSHATFAACGGTRHIAITGKYCAGLCAHNAGHVGRGHGSLQRVTAGAMRDAAYPRTRSKITLPHPRYTFLCKFFPESHHECRQ